LGAVANVYAVVLADTNGLIDTYSISITGEILFVITAKRTVFGERPRRKVDAKNSRLVYADALLRKAKAKAARVVKADGKKLKVN
jgi:uncharacterized protein YxjI